MNHKEKLLQVHQRSLTDKPNLTSEIKKELKEFDNVLENQKGLFTVLLTLGIHKILYPEQDIRKHQNGIPGGCSGRTIDTKFITPTLRELELPSMGETGWLTRSLEQPHPYEKNYPGKIKTGKEPFLNLIHYIETQPDYAEEIVLSILISLNSIKQENIIVLAPLTNPEKVSIEKITNELEGILNKKFKSPGASKFPVLMFQACLKILCGELSRYKNCSLKKIGSHLSADSRSKSSGDLEIFREEILFESYEIKHDVEVNTHTLNRVKEKIYKHNPERYFIFSSRVSSGERKNIQEKIKQIKNSHGCQVIIDDPIKTLKRYLRLMGRLDKFLNHLNQEIIGDKELKIEHKKEWKRAYSRINED